MTTVYILADRTGINYSIVCYTFFVTIYIFFLRTHTTTQQRTSTWHTFMLIYCSRGSYPDYYLLPYVSVFRQRPQDLFIFTFVITPWWIKRDEHTCRDGTQAQAKAFSYRDWRWFGKMKRKIKWVQYSFFNFVYDSSQWLVILFSQRMFSVVVQYKKAIFFHCYLLFLYSLSFIFSIPKYESKPSLLFFRFVRVFDKWIITNSLILQHFSINYWISIALVADNHSCRPRTSLFVCIHLADSPNMHQPLSVRRQPEDLSVRALANRFCTCEQKILMKQVKSSSWIQTNVSDNLIYVRKLPVGIFDVVLFEHDGITGTLNQ